MAEQHIASEIATNPSNDLQNKMPKNCKENRYYYRHREEILAQKREKRLEDPVYQAKQKEKKEAKEKREEEKKVKHALEVEERAKLRAEAKAKMLGVKIKSPSGVEITSLE